jgi:hypothetical protein
LRLLELSTFTNTKEENPSGRHVNDPCDRTDTYAGKTLRTVP